MPRFGGGDGEALSTIDVQHHVNVRASIADVHNAVARNAKPETKGIDRGDFAVARGDLDDVLEVAGFFIEAEVSADDMVWGDDPLQRGVHHQPRRC